MPPSLSPARIYLAWCVVAAVGIAGSLLNRSGNWRGGLLLLAIYGALGLYGLLHYTLAPMPAHTWAMNATIWLEVGTATTLLSAVAASVVRKGRATGSSQSNSPP
jgi:hypothetical protein